MPKVTTNTIVPYRGRAIKAGATVDVPEEVAREWKERGVLHTGRGKTEQEKMRLRLLGATRAQRGEEDEPEERLVFLPVTPAQYDALVEAGYATPESWAAASDEALLAVKGVNEDAVARLRAAAAPR